MLIDIEIGILTKKRCLYKIKTRSFKYKPQKTRRKTMSLDMIFKFDDFARIGKRVLGGFGDNDVVCTFVHVIKEMLVSGKVEYNRSGEKWHLLPQSTKGFRLIAAHVCAAMLGAPSLTDEQEKAIADWCSFWGVEKDPEVNPEKIRMII